MRCPRFRASEAVKFSFDPYSPAVDADPFPFYRTLRDEYPCYFSEPAQVWVLSRYADIVTALNDWQTYSSARGNLMTELPGRAGGTLGTTDPPRHDRLRGLIQHAFVKRNLDGLASPIRDIARSAAAGLAGREHFDFIADFSATFTVRVLFTALGIPLTDEATVRDQAVLMVQTDPVTRAKGPEHIGILVDGCGRTSASAVVAAGDCTVTRLADGSLRRLESVQNAVEQGKAAAAALLGQERPFAATPWFWSQQYDAKLQLAGQAAAANDWVVRGDLAAKAFSVFGFRAGRLAAAASINAPRDHLLARRLLDAGVSPGRQQAADPGSDLAALPG